MFDKQQIAMLQTSFQNMSFLISVLHVQCERKYCSAVALNLFSSAVMVASNSSQNLPNSIFPDWRDEENSALVSILVKVL